MASLSWGQSTHFAEKQTVKTKHPQGLPQTQWSDYAITYLTTLGLIVMGMLTYRAANECFGELALSQYAVMRRIVAFIQPTLAIGLAVALSRRVAARRFDDDSNSESSYLLAALILILASTTAVVIPLILFPQKFAFAFFGSMDYRPHVLAIAPMLVGMGLHVVCYAQLHGRFSMRSANLLQLLNIGLIPFIAIICASSLPEAFFWTGSLIALVSITGIALQIRNVRSAIQGIFPACAQLLRLGPPRVPGDIALALLMVTPATIVTHYCGVMEGGLVAFCVTLLTLAQTTTTPISTLLLPQATALLRSGNVGVLRRQVLALLTVSLVISAPAILVFWLATDFFLTICLGKYAAELPGLAQIIILGALPLNGYTCLRSVVDAGRDRAVNARSCCLSLVCFFIVMPSVRTISSDFYFAPISFVIALFCLAGFTSWEAWQLLGNKPESAEPGRLPVLGKAA